MRLVALKLHHLQARLCKQTLHGFFETEGSCRGLLVVLATTWSSVNTAVEHNEELGGGGGYYIKLWSQLSKQWGI